MLDRFKAITTFIFDVDGVLTNGSVFLLENGLQVRQMNIKDGLALQMAIRNGFQVVIVSGAASEPVLQRFQYLGLQEIHLGVKDKLKFIQDFLEQQQLQWKEVLFMGDDLPDVPVLEKAGMACCPADAAVDVQKISTYISPFGGGAGCVRDVIEKVLKLNNRWIYSTEVLSR